MAEETKPPQRGFWERVGELGPKWITAIAAVLVALTGAGLFELSHTAGTPSAGPQQTATVTNTGSPVKNLSNQSASTANAALSGTVYLTQLQPVQAAGEYAVQPVQIDGTLYQQSIVMGCWPGPDPQSTIYDVAGYKTLTMTLGIPDNTSGTSGISADFTFTKNGNNSPLGSPVSIEVGTSQKVSVNLDGATQLSINCINSGSPDPHAIIVAVGDGVLGAS